jgi:hypothetical protein
MRTTFLPCLPTSGTSVPATPVWLHEIKYDGYRVIIQREGKTVRLFSRNGNDWSGRYPWIVEAALRNKHGQFVIDCEAVVLGVDGIADFNALHSRKHNHEVQLYAFDILALDGEDPTCPPENLPPQNIFPPPRAPRPRRPSRFWEKVPGGVGAAGAAEPLENQDLPLSTSRSASPEGRSCGELLGSARGLVRRK